MAPLAFAALALLATAAQAPAGELSENGGDRITNDDCVLAPASAAAGAPDRDVPAGAHGCQVFDGTGLWQAQEVGAAVAAAVASRPVVLRHVLDLTDSVFADDAPEVIFKLDWTEELDEDAPPLPAVGPARCYGEADGEPTPFRHRRLLGVVSYAWADDRELMKNVDAGLVWLPETLPELCVGNQTAGSAGFESHASRYSVFSPLQDNATWYGFPPAAFDTALAVALHLYSTEDWHRELYPMLTGSSRPVEVELAPGDVLLVPPGWGYAQMGVGEALYTPAAWRE